MNDIAADVGVGSARGVLVGRGVQLLAVHEVTQVGFELDDPCLVRIGVCTAHCYIVFPVQLHGLGR